MPGNYITKESSHFCHKCGDGLTLLSVRPVVVFPASELYRHSVNDQGIRSLF